MILIKIDIEQLYSSFAVTYSNKIIFNTWLENEKKKKEDRCTKHFLLLLKVLNY